MPGHSSAFPIVSCTLDLVIVFHLACLGDRELEFLLPLLVSLFTLFALGRPVLLVPLPHEVLLVLVPHPLLCLCLLRVLVLDQSVDLVCFDPGQLVELCPLIGVFDWTDILRQVSEIFLRRFLLLRVDFDVDSLYERDGHSLTVLLLSVSLELFDLLLVQDFLPS